MDSHFKDIESIGEEVALWLEADSGTPEERFFELQLLFNRLIEIKGEAPLPPDWQEYVAGLENSLHTAIHSLRGEIPQKVATQLNIKVQAEQARHRHSEAAMSRELRHAEKNRNKILIITSLLTCCVLLLGAGIGFYQWQLFMSNEGWFHDIRAERWSTVDRRLDFGKSIETTDTAGRTALLMAAGSGKMEIVQALVEREADLRAVDLEGAGALHYAAASDNPELVAWLLEAGLDPNALDKTGTSPLHELFREGPGSRESLKIMNLLLEAGADPTAGDDEESVLMAAVLWVRGAYFERPLEALRKLIEGGAEVNYRNANGATPLSHAMAKYLPDEPDPQRIAEIDPVIRLLLDAGARVGEGEVGVGSEESTFDQDRLEFLPSVR